MGKQEKATNSKWRSKKGKLGKKNATQKKSSECCKFLFMYIPYYIFLKARTQLLIRTGENAYIQCDQRRLLIYNIRIFRRIFNGIRNRNTAVLSQTVLGMQSH